MYLYKVRRFIFSMENSKIGVSGRRKIVIVVMSFVIAIVFALLVVRTVNTSGVVENGFKSEFYASGFSLLPPVIAIGMALVTKEVYSSLFTGICLLAIHSKTLYLSFTKNSDIDNSPQDIQYKNHTISVLKNQYMGRKYCLII